MDLPDYSSMSITSVGSIKTSFGSIAPKMLSGVDKLAVDVLGVKWLVQDARPFATTASPSFKLYMGAASGGKYEGACYATNKSICAKLAEEAKAKSSAFLQELQDSGIKPCLVGDCWSEGGGKDAMGLFAVTAQGIDKDWNLKSVLVAALPCGGDSHTADFLDTATDAAMEKLGFTNHVDGVMIKVADNASVNKKAWGVEGSGMLGCGPHTLQLAAGKFLSVSEIERTLSKGSGVVGHFNRSTQAKAKLRELQKQVNAPQENLEQHVKTRWNAGQKMCESLVRNKTPILLFDVVADSAGEVYKFNKLNTIDWDLIEETTACLKMASNATQMLEGSKYPTSSLVFPVMGMLMADLSPSKEVILTFRDEQDVRYKLASDQLLEPVRQGRAAMLEDLQNRYILNVPQNVKELLLIATILDPREGFKDLAFLSEADCVFPSSWKTFGKNAFERNFDIHYSPLPKQSSASESGMRMMSTSSGISGISSSIAPRQKEVGVTFSSFFGKKTRCVAKANVNNANF
jgi:hypothetical protein